MDKVLLENSRSVHRKVREELWTSLSRNDEREDDMSSPSILSVVADPSGRPRAPKVQGLQAKNQCLPAMVREDNSELDAVPAHPA